LFGWRRVSFLSVLKNAFSLKITFLFEKFSPTVAPPFEVRSFFAPKRFPLAFLLYAQISPILQKST